MSKLKELIDELCPNGVEYKKLGEVCKKIVSGGTPKSTNASYYNGNIPWLRTQEIDFKDIYNTGMTITEEGLNNSSSKWIPKNCVIIAMYGATVGKVGINKIPLTTNQACCNLEIDETVANYKYIYYFLANSYKKIKSMGQGSQTNINVNIIKRLEIPVPPLEVQSEIVRILDNFTELTAELTARKQQYEYYRDELLKGNDFSAEKVQLNDICEIYDGTHQTPDYKTNGVKFASVEIFKTHLMQISIFQKKIIKNIR